MGSINWQTLYSNKRFQQTSATSAASGRGDYIRDYDRVVFSSQFRKLQNKTQVFPLPGVFFVHNRLTHSLEVASVGRSLGKAVGEKLTAKYQDLFSSAAADFYRFELSDVIQTACLAHDIGNPPFGHFGEEAIRTFFKGLFKEKGNLGLSDNQRLDLEKFEGNANAFRILTSIFAQTGLKLTYTTLASIVKYPSTSLKGFNRANLFTKKSGFFDEELPYFESVAKELGLGQQEEGVWARHPFVYLVEAADDLCYRIIDLEDAYKLKVVGFQEVCTLLLPLFDNSPQKDYLYKKLDGLENEEQKLSLIRALLINHLTQLCADAFMEHEADLLEGKVRRSLIDLLDDSLKLQLKAVDKFSFERIYNHHSVVEKELAGYHVIYGLLEDFVGALLEPNFEKSKKVLRLLPVLPKDDKGLYLNLLGIVDFVSEMTDNSAMDLYRKIRGIQAP